MKDDRKREMRKYCLLYTALLIVIVSSGCLAESSEKIKDLFGFSSSETIKNKSYYQIDTRDLTIPATTGRYDLAYEDTPDPLSERFPGFEISSYNLYTLFYEDSTGVIDVHVKNTGENSIFIYKYGFINAEVNDEVLLDTGITLAPGEEKNIGMVSVDVESNIDKIELRPQIALFAETTSGTWHDYGQQSLENISIEVYERPALRFPRYISNSEKIFKEINSKVDPDSTEVRTMAAASAKKYPGPYNIYQICALFDDTKENIKYISDPRGEDIWSAPEETIALGAGDCDDYAILMASMIESIGGTSRIYMTDTHAFAAVYIGNDTKEIADAISNYYGSVPVYSTSDSYGSWLLLDPTSSLYAGGLPGGTAPIENSWTYINTSKVIVTDISPGT